MTDGLGVHYSSKLSQVALIKCVCHRPSVVDVSSQLLPNYF